MLIAIEGLIGVGKTTLQNILKEHYNAQTLMEEYESNYCLEDYYKEPDRYALQKDMIFLFTGYHQYQKVNRTNSLIIADFTFEKSDIFAKVTLSKEEYERVFLPAYDYLKGKIAPPDLIIYLNGDINIIMNRILERHREMELRISKEFLYKLQKWYDIVIKEMSKTINIITVNIGEYDFLNNKNDIDKLCDLLKTRLE